MDLDELIARERIRDTLARYHLAGDRGRIDELVTCFTPDGVLEIEGEPPFAGREAIAARLRAVVAGSAARGDRARLRHHLTTTRIERLDREAARAWSSFLAVTEAGLDHAGRYADRLRRAGDLWLLAYRRVAVDWVAEGSRFRGES